MKGLAIINAGSLKSIERATLLVGSITLAVSVFLLGNAGLNYFRVNDTEAKLAATQQQIHSLSETISRSKRLKFPAEPGSVLTNFQESLDRIAVQHDCLLTEVTASDETNYSNRYTTDPSEPGWKQVGINCQMIGSLANIMSLLKDATNSSIPVELGNVEISPLESKRNGKPQVLAKVSLQVLRQEKTS